MAGQGRTDCCSCIVLGIPLCLQIFVWLVQAFLRNARSLFYLLHSSSSRSSSSSTAVNWGGSAAAAAAAASVTTAT